MRQRRGKRGNRGERWFDRTNISISIRIIMIIRINIGIGTGVATGTTSFKNTHHLRPAQRLYKPKPPRERDILIIARERESLGRANGGVIGMGVLRAIRVIRVIRVR